MNLHQGLRAFLCLLLGFTIPAVVFAATEEQNPPLVEVHIPQDNLAPYKERRLDHGYYFSLGYEALVLNHFTSGIDLLTYDELFGSNPIPLIKVEFDYKYNTGLGSLVAGLELGMGKNSSAASGTERSLEVMKYGIATKFVADMIWKEPYVAPYVGLNVWQMELNEETPTEKLNEKTSISYNYTIGLMLQLDWIDYNTAKQATFNLGLENTFIDLYVTQYMNTGDESEANTETDFLYGANIRFEF